MSEQNLFQALQFAEDDFHHIKFDGTKRFWVFVMERANEKLKERIKQMEKQHGETTGHTA